MAMAGVSNLILVVLNVITTFVGGAIAGFGAWLATRDPGECLQYMHSPILVFGCCIMAFSLLALCAAFFKMGLLLRLYLLLMFALICGLLVFALFTFVVTHKSTAKTLSNLGYKQYRLADFSDWLQSRVHDASRWSRIRACLRDSKMCFYDLVSEMQFLSKAVQYLAADTYKGCCIPPETCGFSSSGVVYINPSHPNADADCNTFDNNPDMRCFDCNACPAGVLQSITINWKKIAVGAVVIAAVLLVIYIIGCQAL
ncbi:hypothetical protein L7F22_026208 [Adiantum nelumboides]|nr:hypothetical protein [Adiantum nelumboides]